MSRRLGARTIAPDFARQQAWRRLEHALHLGVGDRRHLRFEDLDCPFAFAHDAPLSLTAYLPGWGMR